MSPDPTQFDRVFKLAICGSAKTGKKTLLQSFCTEGEGENIWTTLNVDDEKVLVEATVSVSWTHDMAQKFDAVAIVFATNDLFSFEYSLELLNEIQRKADLLPIVFIENKIDEVENTELDKKMVEDELKKKHKRLYRVAAIKEFNVMHPFAYLLEKLTRQKKDENANERKHSSPVDSIRMPSREGWGEATVIKAKKEQKCILM